MFEIIFIVVCAGIIYLVGFINGNQWAGYKLARFLYEQQRRRVAEEEDK